MSKLALLGGTPVFESTPAVAWPIYGEAERRYLEQVLTSRDWGGYPHPSPLSHQFATAFAAHHDAQHGVCATNGSVTLEVALTALGLEAGDEVITTSYTWIASAVCAIHVNAVPVLVDIDPNTYTLDPDLVEAAITPRTRAIVAVHLGANLADLDRLKAIADKHDLYLIEDCAHAHGGAWRGKGVGSHGVIGSFSFQKSKLMTSGEGGALITSDDDLIQRCHSIINCGRKEPGYDTFEGWPLGVNARLSEFQAAVLLGQLERLDEVTAQRERALRRLDAGLAEVGGLRPLAWDPRITTRPAYQTIMKFDPEAFAGITRDRFLEALRAEGVNVEGDFYVPLPDHELYNASSKQWPQLRARYGETTRGDGRAAFPNAAKAAYDEAVWLHYPYLMMDDGAVDRVVEAVAKIKSNAADLR